MILEIVSVETHEGELVDVYELREHSGGPPVTDIDVIDRLVETEAWQNSMDLLRTPPNNGHFYPHIVTESTPQRESSHGQPVRIYTRHSLNKAPSVIKL